jgi:hypothetical protein
MALAPTDDFVADLADSSRGFGVARGVLTAEQVETARSLYWDWLEGLGSGLQRSDPSTWTNAAWPGMASLGFTTTHGGFKRTKERKDFFNNFMN